MRLTIIQPALPAYRRGLFERIASQLRCNYAVYASQDSRLGVLANENGPRPPWQHDLGPIRQLLPGLEWQTGALSVPVSRGDVLIVSGAPRTLSTLALIFKGKLKRAHVIWWGHYWTATSKPWRAAIRFALMRVPDAVLFYTDQEVAEYRAQRGGQLGKPVFGLNNGIETSQIVRLRKPYEPNERARDLLFIGRITQKAELDLLLNALARPECKGVTLDIIGDGEGIESLQERAVSLRIAERLRWHHGTVDEERIAAVANQCKAFVYPGSVGLSLIHGLAYGLPAIVHSDRWTHMPEIAAFKIGRTGVSFTKGNAGSLAQAIRDLLSDRVNLASMSIAAIETTNKTFNVADMADRFCHAISVIQPALLRDN